MKNFLRTVFIERAELPSGVLAPSQNLISGKPTLLLSPLEWGVTLCAAAAVAQEGAGRVKLFWEVHCSEFPSGRLIWQRRIEVQQSRSLMSGSHEVT